MREAAWLLALPLAALACQRAEPIVSCDAVGPAKPICGFHNPEDLEPLPGGRELLVSEFGSMDGGRPGALALLELGTEARRVLYEGGAPGEATPGWGDPACPGPPPREMSPHGIHLGRRPDGALQLLVVNHGGRESVEFFEATEGAAGWELAWRGCAVAPADAWMNDVVATPDGGFFASSMMPRREGVGRLVEYAKAAALGMKTGRVLAWRPGAGYSALPGSETVFPNGLALSPDGATLFVNSSLAGEVHRIDLASGRQTGSAKIPGPDNTSWSPDGLLLVASFTGGLFDTLACEDLPRGACPAAFQIVVLDPRTLATQVAYRGGGAPMGAGTVGIRVGDELFIGSFAGDRILRVKL